MTIDPRVLPQSRDGGILERADLLLLRMIADSWPERPVYISRTAGAYGEMLGLGNHLLSQGLARKTCSGASCLTRYGLYPWPWMA